MSRISFLIHSFYWLLIHYFLLVTAPPDRKYSAWIGGSKKASSINDSQWLTSALFDKFGDGIIERMFCSLNKVE